MVINLKKKALSVIAVLLFSLFFIPEVYALKISAGIKGGLGLSNLVDADNSKVKLAGNLGAICDIQFNNWLACEVFLGWRNMGYRYDNGTINERIELNYFHFEPVAKIFFSVSGTRLYAIIGGYVSGIMSSSGASRSSHTDVGCTLGIGINLKLSEKFHLLIETNGNFGFKTLPFGGGRNIAGYLSAGLLFDLN